ncbi:adhesion G-protein coupled receptor G4-like isoform X2 [Phyllopteryx taeniolatus]|uniref:adhesion G-protein coupled receptor G4-like isoform X2 n=1 Tax=Phyllopteryx taeniolatus TaxID=161469 RepID=UPI002AD222A5|nr:adhesion G-protein coupled receptor G4-like isoform X2 [Phyllopteryx taeniolatus]
MDPKDRKNIRTTRSESAFLQVLWLFYLGASPLTAFGYFLGDTKAVLHGCEDHWTLQQSASVPLLFQMSVCLDVRVLAPGAWVAFSYSSVHDPRPELGLEGDEGALYGWLLGVRHRFPVSLAPARWHRVCLRRDVPGNSFSLELAGRLVAKRTVIARAVTPSGSLWLGCRPRRRAAGAATAGRVEVYMFRVWADLGRHGPCEDGTVIGWNARFWGVTSPRARQTDRDLSCAQTTEFESYLATPPVSMSADIRHQREPPSVTVTPSGHGEKPSLSSPNPSATTSPGAESISDVATSLDVTGSTSTITTAAPTLAPPTVHTPAGHISSSTRTPPARSHKSNHTTTGSLPPSANNALENNVTAVTSLKPFIKDTSPSNRTTTSATSDSNVTTHYKGFTHLTSDTTVSDRTQTLRPSANNTLDNKVTIGSAITPLIKDIAQYSLMTPSSTSDYNVTTHKSFTHLLRNVTTDLLRPFANHTLEYNVTKVSAIRALIEHTSKYNPSTPSLTSLHNGTTHYKTTTNDTTAHNTTTSDLLLPFANSTLEYNVSPVTPDIKDTSPRNLTAPSTTSIHNVTTHKSFTRLPNDAAMYNTTTDRLLTSANNTLEYKVSTITPFSKDTSPYSLSKSSTSLDKVTTHKVMKNDTTVYNITATSTTLTDTKELNVTPLSTVTPLVKDTPRNSLTIPSATSVDDVSTRKVFPNNTTVYNVRAADTSRPADNRTTYLLETTISTITPLIKDTARNSLTTPSATSVDRKSTHKTFTRLVSDATLDNVTASRNESGILPLIKDTSQNNFTPPSAQSVNNVTTHYNTFSPTADRTMQNNETTDTVLVKSTATFTTTTSDDTQLDNVRANHYATAADSYTERDVSTAARNPTGRVSVAARHNATAAEENKHPSWYNATTSGDVTPPNDRTATELASEALDQISSNNRDDTSTASARNHPQHRVDLSTTAGISREPLARASTTVTATTTETRQSQAIGMTSTSSSGTKTNREQQADKLVEETRSASQLNSSQVAQLVAELQKLLDAPGVSQALAEKVVRIVSNLMDADPLALAASADRIIGAVEDLGLKLLVSDTSAVLSSRSLVLAVRKVDGGDFPEMSVDIFNTDDVQMNVAHGSGKSESTVASVYLPSSITEGLSGDEHKQVDRVQFTFYSKPVLFQDNTLSIQTVVSPVLACSVSNVSVSNLSDNIQFTIGNRRPAHSDYEAVCAFWDVARNGGSGGWSSAGCSAVSATSWATTCACNHLTAFAILLDLSRGGINDPRQAQILTFITYIGCGVSAIFLAATLLTYLSFAKLLRDVPAKILVQLCSSLLLLDLAYLLDGWLAQYPARGLCIGAAFFLHYFLLTSFTWAGLEALHMYLSIVRVFTPYLSRYMLKFSLIGWGQHPNCPKCRSPPRRCFSRSCGLPAGVPVVVVVAVISADKDNYGLVTYGRDPDATSGDFCWLRSDAAFYAGVVAYFLLIFASCLLVFGVVMAQLRRIKRQNPHNQSPHRGAAADLRSVAGLLALLGLAWGFALFAWGPLHLPFVYLFTVLNSLQGFFVFVFHCACKENVRRQWRTFLCCGRLRLAENSEWSRTAAREKRKLSVTTLGASARQLASRSSSVGSGSTASVGSVFADSGLSEGSSGDVVLNELYRQTVTF